MRRTDVPPAGTRHAGFFVPEWQKGYAMSEHPLTHSIANVCRLTGISRSSIYNAIRFGHLRAVKYAGRTLIRDDDLKAFLDKLPQITPKASAHG